MQFGKSFIVAGSIALSAIAASAALAQSTYPFTTGPSIDSGERVMAFASRIDDRLRTSTDALRRVSLPSVASIDLFGSEFAFTDVSAKASDGAQRGVSHIWFKSGGRWRVLASAESTTPGIAQRAVGG